MRTSITSRRRKRRQRNGRMKVQQRFVLNYRDPRTLKRVQRFFERREDAEAARDRLLVGVAQGVPPANKHGLTVGQVLEHWLSNREGEVTPATLLGYRRYSRYVMGPLPARNPNENKQRGDRSKVETIGHVRIEQLSVAGLRRWQQALALGIGRHAARRARMLLKASLALAAEDFGVRPPPLPRMSQKGHKDKKAVLSLEGTGLLLAWAQNQPRGLYVAFPFLTGVRPGEQLALLWEDVNFDESCIQINKTQTQSGDVVPPKTPSSVRVVPMGPALKMTLLEWRVRCPRLNGQLHRVFPAALGGPLRHPQFLSRIWQPMLAKVGVSYVTPHSARHSYISALQAAGCEVAVASRLVGHANPGITASVYSHALRGGEDAVAALERVYTGARREG